jgi:hypothetical protein
MSKDHAHRNSRRDQAKNQRRGFHFNYAEAFRHTSIAVPWPDATPQISQILGQYSATHTHDFTLLDKALEPFAESLRFEIGGAQAAIAIVLDQLGPINFGLGAIASDLGQHLLPAFDDELMARVREYIEAGQPPNLRGIYEYDDLFAITLDEGIPLAWLPRTEIVEVLLTLHSCEARERLLVDSSDEILDDCLAALESTEGEYADRCREAIATYRDGHPEAAQSHAANIVDSLVLDVCPRRGRDRFKAHARIDVEPLTLDQMRTNLAVRPLVRAFVTWSAGSGRRPPEQFSRHATAHAAGEPGVFSPLNGLLAIMLASSLVAEYGYARLAEVQRLAA